MTRGFITIATGGKHYYKIAANLVRSYRLHTKNPFPFAIIAEEENEYTQIFDDIILTTESTRSFMDKFLLMKLCPYDESIFIDADSLAYGDLNAYWDLFENATDFSALGVNVDREAKEGAWYNVEDLGKYGEGLPYKSRVHSGVCFIRRSEALKKLYEDSMELIEHYDEMHFHTYPTSKDECVMGVAMPMNNMRATRGNPSMLAAYPCLNWVKADMLNDILRYNTDWGGTTERGLLLHFGTFHTHEPLYRFNVSCMELRGRSLTGWEKLLYKYKLKYYVTQIGYSIGYFCRRVINKILRQLKNK